MNIADLVKEATTSTSTSAITLGGASAGGFRTFASGLAVGATNIPVIIGPDSNGAWLEGLYTLSGSSTLTRTQILASSAGGADVTLAAGSKDVRCVMPAYLLSSGLVDPDDVGFDIVVCAGQSNMCGRGTLDTLADIADSRVYQFGGYSTDARFRTIFSGANPIHNQEGVNTGNNSPQVAFANAYAASAPVHRKVLLVPTARGGTPLVSGAADWAAGSPGNTLYENMIAQATQALTAAKALYPASRIVGMIWHQGEADTQAGISQTAYATALKALIAGFRTRLSVPNAWCVIGGLAPGFLGAGNPQNIDLAHKQVANETVKCAFAAPPTGFDDQLHFNAQGVRLLGAKMAAAVRKAMYSAGTVVPASALVVSVSPSSVVVGSSATVTVTTDQPLTGSQTVTASVTEPMSGNAGAASVTLSASSGSAQLTFTPSAPGSGNITATQTAGTPTVSAGSAAFTATASATVPGAPTIGAATAGNASASVAFTAPASNGGAAISGYTVTSTPGGITATGATSPINVTGLTNGTAYTFTVRATNSVGNSAESAASNSVTPSVPAQTLSIVGSSGITATGTANVYQASGGFWGAGAVGGRLNLAFQATTDGEFIVQMLDAPKHVADSTGREIGVGVAAAQLSTGTVGDYTLQDHFLMHRADGIQAYAKGTSGTDLTGVTPVQNDYLRVKRTGSSITLAVSSDAGATWKTIKTYATASTGVLYCYVLAIYTTTFKLVSSSGLA